MSEAEVAVMSGGASGLGRGARGLSLAPLERDGERAAAEPTALAEVLLAGEPYIVIHGDLPQAVERRAARSRVAAVAAEERA